MADLNSLIIFARVAEANSFSEAARRLKMPTSTVSRRIAELETQLGVRLIERSTRNLRLTKFGSEVLEHAQRGTELSEAIESIASNHVSKVSGILRLSAPPSISDSLLVPLVTMFQAAYPEVHIQIFISERFVDHIADGIDLAFRVSVSLKDSALIPRRILRYRHQLLASPAYLEKLKPPQTPQDLRSHRLLSFMRQGRPETTWRFAHVSGKDKQSINFQPFLSMNDYTGLAAALLADEGIGDLPPIVQPHLLRNGQLVEILPKWHFRTVSLWLVHLGNRHISRPVRVFKEFTTQMVPKLFPKLPD
ncbi:MAG: LysR family transcriptional regulator [Acidobacteriaceae bacterium]|nr:LysR family transcriptional regulator [Acidobacteriaceae bacterium]